VTYIEVSVGKTEFRAVVDRNEEALFYVSGELALMIAPDGSISSDDRLWVPVELFREVLSMIDAALEPGDPNRRLWALRETYNKLTEGAESP